jgi:hypothetical protein
MKAINYYEACQSNCSREPLRRAAATAGSCSKRTTTEGLAIAAAGAVHHRAKAGLHPAFSIRHSPQRSDRRLRYAHKGLAGAQPNVLKYCTFCVNVPYSGVI